MPCVAFTDNYSARQRKTVKQDVAFSLVRPCVSGCVCLSAQKLKKTTDQKLTQRGYDELQKWLDFGDIWPWTLTLRCKLDGSAARTVCAPRTHGLSTVFIRSFYSVLLFQSFSVFCPFVHCLLFCFLRSWRINMFISVARLTISSTDGQHSPRINNVY